MDAFGGDGGRIQFYTENTTVFGQPTQNNIRLAILSMPLGSVMVAWQGSGPGRLGNALVFVHDFSLYLRAPEDADVGYEDLFNWIVNDISAGSSLRMLHTQIDTNCEPMDFYRPSARRNTVVISADGATQIQPGCSHTTAHQRFSALSASKPEMTSNNSSSMPFWRKR